LIVCAAINEKGSKKNKTQMQNFRKLFLIIFIS
jgi:hypothetical protein